MEDIAYSALLAGDSVIAWVGAFLLAALVKFVAGKIGNDTASKIVVRALNEIGAAVAEVWQIYVAELKEANADGKLTGAEKAEAKAKAIKKAKALIGKEGLARLAHILGTDALDGWLSNKIEAEIDARKSLGAPDPT